MTKQKRRWLDGPRWAWLCRVFGHQMNWYHWYVGSGDIFGNAIVRCLGWGLAGPTPSWHYHGTNCMEGRICGRCDAIIGSRPKLAKRAPLKGRYAWFGGA